jgi:aryl-alcohol dehydrogenase-like predicted oxidoreductase
MARELGLGVTPWSPLKSGVLSGKYSREDHGKHNPGRGAYATSALNDKTYDLLDEMKKIAGELRTTVSRVAIAWVQARPGVTSTIIGARTMEQLDDNLAALDVVLTPAHITRLDALSKPGLNFPADFVANGAAFFHGGTTINGRSAEPWPASPKNDDDRW